MENYNKELEINLIDMVKEKEKADKRLLIAEIFIGIFSTSIFLGATVVAAYANIDEIWRVLIIVLGLVPFLIAVPFMLKIEQVAGYYECKKCGNRYVPTMKSVNMAMHMGRTRYMKCPKCNQRSWQKKVLSKNDDN